MKHIALISLLILQVFSQQANAGECKAELHYRTGFGLPRNTTSINSLFSIQQTNFEDCLSTSLQYIDTNVPYLNEVAKKYESLVESHIILVTYNDQKSSDSAQKPQSVASLKFFSMDKKSSWSDSFYNVCLGRSTYSHRGRQLLNLASGLGHDLTLDSSQEEEQGASLLGCLKALKEKDLVYRKRNTMKDRFSVTYIGRMTNQNSYKIMADISLPVE